MRTSRISLVTFTVLMIAGCTVGPNYKRPVVSTPTTFRDDTTAALAADSLGDAKWWTVFQDQQLQSLIRTALQQNYDVRIAAARVDAAQAQLGITRAGQFPTLGANADLNTQHNPKNGPFPEYELHNGAVNLSAAWELDFWGKYRRATEAARANLLATEWGQRAVTSTLVSDVATAYFQLRELDLELDIARKTLSSRQGSLKLQQALEQNGSTSLVDVRQSEQLVYTASAEVPGLERQIRQQENFLSILLGQNPGEVPRGLGLVDQPHSPAVPAGLPSALLERRPDIRQAEENLIASNAEIGVARSDYFPQIALTGEGGFVSDGLSRLFSGSSGLWSFGPTLTQPIFTAGKIHSNVRLAEAQQQEALLDYQQTIRQAFRDVSDALIAYQKDRELREEQEKLTSSAQDATRLANVRYSNGIASYLEVLTNDSNYFAAELNLAQARRNELTDLVHLYNALGGGWQQQ